MGSRAPAGAIDALAKVALFAGCDRKQLAEIARLGTVINVAEGAILTQQGRPGREFVLLLGHKEVELMNGLVSRPVPIDEDSICIVDSSCVMRPTLRMSSPRKIADRVQLRLVAKVCQAT